MTVTWLLLNCMPVPFSYAIDFVRIPRWMPQYDCKEWQNCTRYAKLRARMARRLGLTVGPQTTYADDSLCSTNPTNLIVVRHLYQFMLECCKNMSQYATMVSLCTLQIYASAAFSLSMLLVRCSTDIVACSGIEGLHHRETHYLFVLPQQYSYISS